jgi:osmoprotectant transport system permease protein
MGRQPGGGAVKDFLDAFTFIGDHLGFLFDLTRQQLELSGAAVGVSLLIAIPLGLWLGHLHRGAWLAISVSNVGRALPSLGVVAVGIGVFGLGFLNVMIALVILAVPPMLTNAYVAIDGVDEEVVEAARGMGMSPLQILLRVELPLGLPLLFAGIRTAAVYVVATATLASLAGGGGLGDVIFNQASYRLSGVVAAAMWVSALSLLVEGAFALLQRLVTPVGIRRAAPALGPVLETAGTTR